jgi:hypothetical protein
VSGLRARTSPARRLTPLALAAACALLVEAGASASAQTTGRPGLVVKVAPVTLSPGGKAETTVTLEIEKGYRIVATGTVSRFAQPALFAVDAADGVFVQPVVWPAGKSWRAQDEDPEVKVYEGRVNLKLSLRASPKAVVQEVELQGRLRYQAIKADFFEKVAVMPVSIPVKVAAPAAKAAPPAKGAATRP